MLTFLTGTYFTAKKEYIYEKIRALLEDGKKVYLIVPEQASFDRDRDFLMTYGERLSNMLTVTSFTHLSRDVLEENGLRVKPEADEAARNVLMSIACEECGDDLEIFRKYQGKMSLVKKLLDEYSEIKQAGLGTDDLFGVSASLPDGILKNKTLELARVFSSYESIITERFSDSSDNIRVMHSFLCENRIFEGAYIFFDDFRGFTGAQIKLMEEIFAQAEECWVSVSAPGSVNDYDSGSFTHTVRNCRKLRECANRRGVRCFEEKITGAHPVKAIDALSNSLFAAEKEACEDADGVTILRAKDKYAECDLVALKVKQLLEEDGLRCKNISITERSGNYTETMTASLKKYGIPVFNDKRIPLYEYPLIKMILNAVSVAAFGFSTDVIFSYIKTGIVGIDIAECSVLENYAYIWQTDPNAWTNPFTGHPDGFGEEVTPESGQRLQKINEIREKAVLPIIKLKKELEKNDGAASCKAVYQFLVKTKASDNFLQYAKKLYEQGNEAAATECSAVWDCVTGSLDALNETLSGRSVAPKRFYELLKIILTSSDVGRIPAGIDEIVIGNAGRTRHLEPEAVFVLGCNEGSFPLPPVSGGLFTSQERRLLCSNEFPLENIPENMYAEERTIAYSVLTGTIGRLFVSYSSEASDGAPAQPSEIISEIKSILPGVKTVDAGNIPCVEYIGSEDTAFEQFAANYRVNSVYAATLKEYASESRFSHLTEAVKAASSDSGAVIKDTDTAKALFGTDMYISPSKAETFHSCAFRYFCQYGMNIRKLRPADLDARINGLLIHHLLENILIVKTNKELAEITADELKALINDITEKFIEDFMGGRQDKSVLLNRSLDKTKDTAFAILSRMIKEFASSKFSTVAVELEISSKGEVAPYSLKLPDGGSITVGGKVDRVDVMEDGSRAYVRVVDYKTGGKDFKLSDVFDGLNMQMLIYLMCIWDKGLEKYPELIPAGILYVPANNSGDFLPRNADNEDIENRKLINGRMNGMILEDENILKGMEENCEGKFINAYIDDKGRMKGTFLSLNGFKNLKEKIDDVLISMGSALHNGKIGAVPVIGSSSYKYTCDYCDYKDICRRTDESPKKEPLGLTHAKASEMLKGCEDNG